jgi:hypothetical protein
LYILYSAGAHLRVGHAEDEQLEQPVEKLYIVIIIYIMITYILYCAGAHLRVAHAEDEQLEEPVEPQGGVGGVPLQVVQHHRHLIIYIYI